MVLPTSLVSTKLSYRARYLGALLEQSDNLQEFVLDDRRLTSERSMIQKINPTNQHFLHERVDFF